MTEGSITAVVVALIAAGLLNYVRDAVKAIRARRAASTPEARDALHVTAADQSLLVVVKARDELADDNERLRTTITEERARHAEDRATWAAEKLELRQEIDDLESKLRALLDEVTSLRERHAT